MEVARLGRRVVRGVVAATALLAASVVWGESAAPEDPNSLSVTVDASVTTGTINRQLLGVNQGPLTVYPKETGFRGNNAVDLTPYYRQLGVASVRLDEFGAIDLQQLFPDFSADPQLPASYNFELADTYIKAIRDAGAEVFFRMGYGDRPNRTEPPSDYAKWADVMVQIIKHYNAGWADGYEWNIRYWEVWNEPSGLGWTGTPQQYFDLYEAAARKVKAFDSTLRVGGPALGGPDVEKDKRFAADFIAFCASRQLPLDFFSWHAYVSQPQEYIEHTERHRRVLDAAGYTSTESILTEWGWHSGVQLNLPPAADMAGVRDAAADTSILAILQDRVDMAHFYVGGAMDGYPWGLFDYVHYRARVAVKPRKSYYAFKAYGALADCSTRLQCEQGVPVEQNGCAVLAGMNETKDRIVVLLSNYGTGVKHYRLTVKAAPWITPTRVEVRALDRGRDLEVVQETEIEDMAAVPLDFDVEVPSVCLVRLAPWGL